MGAPGSEQERSYLLKRAIHEALDERAKGQTGESVELGYGKWWARFRGAGVSILVIALILVAGIFFLGQKLEAHNTQMLASEEKQAKAIQESNDIQNAMIYVLWVCRGGTKTDGECQNLNLVRPKKVSEMMSR